MIRVTKDGYRGKGIYVGCPSKWGNPFRLRKHGGQYSLRESLREYTQWVKDRPELVKELARVYKKQGYLQLDCWCVDKVYENVNEIKSVRCHAEILAWLVLKEVSK